MIYKNKIHKYQKEVTKTNRNKFVLIWHLNIVPLPIPQHCQPRVKTKPIHLGGVQTGFILFLTILHKTEKKCNNMSETIYSQYYE